MKSARDRAIEIARRLLTPNFSAALFLQLLDDDSEAGKGAREAVRLLAKEIEADRRACAAEGKPS